MRHDHSLPPDYFEEMFKGNSDPWSFETSDYEAAKFDRTIAALGTHRYASAFEIGCANGVLTQKLAALCDRVLAIDVSRTAVDLARQRCGGLSHIFIDVGSFPAQAPDPAAFDLILLSEVAYYWDDGDLARAADWLAALSPGATILLVHWTSETDYPQSGDDAVAKLARRLSGLVAVVTAERQPCYRLDLWRRV